MNAECRIVRDFSQMTIGTIVHKSQRQIKERSDGRQKDVE